MSRRLLLAAGGVASTIPDPPEGTPGPDGWPTTSDPNIVALRPTTLPALTTATATPGDDIGTHVTALSNTVAAQLDTPYGNEGPEHSATLFLPPGEYVGGFGTGRWLSIVGTTGDPADVVIFSDTIAADGVTHPYAPLYVEGVTFKGGHNASLDQSPKYAAHIGGSARTTFVNTVFDMTDAHASSAADPTWGTSGSVGMDGVAGTVLTFYGCTFHDAGDAPSRIGMNLHGGATGVLPSVVSFVNCTAVAGVSYGGPGDLTGDPDEFYVIGGTIGGTIAALPTTHVYTNLANTVTGDAPVTRDVTTWPQPVGHGLIETWFDNFFPSNLAATGTTITRATVTDAAPMTPVAGRTYYCPIPVQSALWFNRYGLQVHSGSGKAVSYRPDPDRRVSGNDFTNNMPDDIEPLENTTLPSGQWLAGFYYSWIRYPSTSVGGTRMWFDFRMADTTGVSIDGSAELPGLHDCYYSDDDGTTMVKATAGTPFPLAHGAQVR